MALCIGIDRVRFQQYLIRKPCLKVSEALTATAAYSSHLGVLMTKLERMSLLVIGLFLILTVTSKVEAQRYASLVDDGRVMYRDGLEAELEVDRQCK